jgi:hypothetical protein
MTFGPQWTVPQPPPSGDRPIRGGKIAAGIGLAMLGHLITIGIGVLAVIGAANASIGWLYLGLGAQVALFVACLTVGIVWIVKRDRGLGIGLLVGWAVGVIVLPVIGFGVCVALLNSQSGGSF